MTTYTPEDEAFTDDRPNRRVRGRKSPVIVVAGSTGGVGATTASLMLAEIAAGVGRIPRVVLVDARTGRSDIRTWLSANAKLPSLATAVIEDDVRLALADSGTLNAHRPSSLNNISFGAILTDQENYTPTATVLEAIDSARDIADLVIVDVGPYDLSPESTYLRVGVRLLQFGAWGLVVAELSRLSAPTTIAMLGGLNTVYDIPRDRLAVLVNKVDAAFGDHRLKSGKTRLDDFLSRLVPTSMVLGAVPDDDKGVRDPMMLGQIPTKHLKMGSAMGTLLRRVTGREEFEALSAAAEVDPSFLANEADDDYSNQRPHDASSTKRRGFLRRG